MFLCSRTPQNGKNYRFKGCNIYYFIVSLEHNGNFCFSSYYLEVFELSGKPGVRFLAEGCVVCSKNAM